MRVEFKRQVSLDTIVATIALLVTLGGLAWSLSARLTALEVKMDVLWSASVKSGR